MVSEFILPFYKDILQEVISEDSLVVLSPGLGLEIILTSLIEIFLNPKNLVLILNAEKDEIEFITSQIKDNKNLKIINSKTSLKTRLECYLTQGVVFIQPRILIYDILVRKVPLTLITGIVIFHAHSICLNTHLEFVLRVFQEKNSKMFIKAFSDFPASFTREFNQVSRTLRSLHVKNLFLWPRFQVDVSKILDSLDIDVVELGVSLSYYQNIIQTALSDMLSQFIRNFLKYSPELKMYHTEFTLDKVLSRGFLKDFSDIIPSIGSMAKCFLEDIKVIRRLIYDLSELTAFKFHDKLEIYKNIYQTAFTSTTGNNLTGSWIITDQADSIFLHSNQRLAYISGKFDRSADSEHARIISEVSPKWKALWDVLDEIADTKFENCETPSKWRVLILTHSKTTLTPFFKYKENPKKFLESMLVKRPVKDILEENVYETQIALNFINSSKEALVWSEKVEYSVVSSLSLFEVRKALYSFYPHIVVLFDVKLEWIRTLEVYKAVNINPLYRVYLIFYKNSIEERIYLSSLETEKSAFEALINEKAIIALPENDYSVFDKEIRIDSDSRAVNNDYLGSIIVDSREFGSKLPLILYKTGFDIRPVCLEIGDYVLTQDTGVERKSIPDLISSLNSGRMYEQAMALTRHYKNAFLLIEFSEEKLFSSQNFSKRRKEYSSNLDVFYVQTRLLILLIHCPTLRLFWSLSPEYTPKIFSEIKRDKPEPNSDLAASVTSTEQAENENVETNKTFDILIRLPSVTFKNVFKITNKVRNFFDLVQLSKSEFTNFFDCGENLFDFFNTPFNNDNQ